MVSRPRSRSVVISRTSRGAFVTRNEMSSGSSWDSHTGHHGHCAHSGTPIGRSIGVRRAEAELLEAGSDVMPGWFAEWFTGAVPLGVEPCLVTVHLPRAESLEAARTGLLEVPRTESLEAVRATACLATLTRKLCSWS